LSEFIFYIIFTTDFETEFKQFS